LINLKGYMKKDQD